MQDKSPPEKGPEELPQETKDGKAFAFRKLKQPKKEKPENRTKSSKQSPYEGEGVLFKAKLIGLESVPDARGDKMCQEAMLKLKMNVKSTGTHKRKIHICVSLQGIKIKDEKTGVVLYHHPVNFISFISQDITDARAFGYVFGSTSEPHQFIAIKTDKPAFHVVLALRDLFQTVLNHKQETIDNAKEEAKEEQVKDLSVTELPPLEEMTAKEENIYFEVLMTEPLPVPEERKQSIDHLLGLEDEMNQLKQGITSMDTSIAAAAAFNEEIPPPSETDPFDTSFVLGPKRDSFPLPMPTPIPVPAPEENFGDKYAVFNAIDASGPSIFEAPIDQVDSKPDEVPLPKSVPPPKPPRSSQDLSIFADLDPLGKDRPYKDKTEFFQDVKNPPKKVLNDLVDPNKESPLSTFPVDFESMSSPPSVNPLSSYSNPSPLKKTESQTSSPLKQSLDYSNPFEGSLKKTQSQTSSPNPIPLSVDYSNPFEGSLKKTQSQTSSPIPIPLKQPLSVDCSFSNESPTTDYYTMSSYTNSEGNSPQSKKNGVSRPRPRTSKAVSSQSLSSDSSSDYEAISRENMQSIANVLLEKNIFSKKKDPFADDPFFYSKGHPECV